MSDSGDNIPQPYVYSGPGDILGPTGPGNFGPTGPQGPTGFIYEGSIWPMLFGTEDNKGPLWKYLETKRAFQGSTDNVDPG